MDNEPQELKGLTPVYNYGLQLVNVTMQVFCIDIFLDHSTYIHTVVRTVLIFLTHLLHIGN